MKVMIASVEELKFVLCAVLQVIFKLVSFVRSCIFFGNIVTGFAKNASSLHSGVEIKSVQLVARSLYPSVHYDQIRTLMH